ncbi:MAG: hypothetical protein ACRDIE_10260, partial [Chloroflexota bacterium]
MLVLLCFVIIVVLRLANIVYQQSLINAATTRAVSAGSPARSAAGATPSFFRVFMAGGVTSPSEHAYIDVLNPTAQLAHLHLTFFFGKERSNTRLLSVPAASWQEVPVASLETFTGSFGLRIVADKQIAAVLRLSRPGRDDDAITGNAGPATTWYLAEGKTSPPFRESVAILNPNSQRAAHVILHLLPQGNVAPRNVSETVAAHSHRVVDINELAPNQI